MRRLFVAGNWKMNTTLAAGRTLAASIAEEVAKTAPDVDVMICPPFPYLLPVGQALANTPVTLGAQNAHFEKPGAFTGETSLEMLVDVGCRGVILGHSERRQFFHETDDVINRKIHAAWQQGLDVVFCIGESLAERESGQMEAVLTKQLHEGLSGVQASQLAKLVIAYEPVWAIGTGKTASPQQAEEAHAFIRRWLTTRFDEQSAQKIRIQYGGSVKADNARELLSQPNVDGALVGGASLKSDQFLGIVQAAAELTKAGKR